MTIGEGVMLTDSLRLERKLGEGAMGSVWLATNLSLDSKVAVKVLHTADKPELQQRFEREARGAAKIDSPHVVQVFDYGVTDDAEPYLVMELLSGEDLGARLDRAGPMSLMQTGRAIRHICRALSRAHAIGVVHRDIKPANVFLVDMDEDLFVKVLDFGIAKFATAADMGMTDTGALLGTPYFMSPEQLMDPKSVDHRTDLWAVGVLAYTCLTDDLPFHGDTVGALSVAIYKGDFPAVCEVREGLPAELDGWMAKALSTDLDTRFSSAKEMADAFDAALTGVSSAHSAPRVVVATDRDVASDRAASLEETALPDQVDHAADTVALSRRSGEEVTLRSKRGGLLAASGGGAETESEAESEAGAESEAKSETEPETEPESESKSGAAASVAAAPAQGVSRASLVVGAVGVLALGIAVGTRWTERPAPSPAVAPTPVPVATATSVAPTATATQAATSAPVPSATGSAEAPVASAAPSASARRAGVRVVASQASVRAAVLNCWQANEGSKPGHKSSSVLVDLPVKGRGFQPFVDSRAFASAPRFRECAHKAAVRAWRTMPKDGYMRIAVSLPGTVKTAPFPSPSQARAGVVGCWRSTEGGEPGAPGQIVRFTVGFQFRTVNPNFRDFPKFRACTWALLKDYTERARPGDRIVTSTGLPPGPSTSKAPPPPAPSAPAASASAATSPAPP